MRWSRSRTRIAGAWSNSALRSARCTCFPTSLRRTASPHTSAADSGGYALVAGRLVAEKGFDLAIAAALAARVPLVVAGSGPDERGLRVFAAGGDVRFTGWLPEDELAQLRAGAGAVLVPSRWEEVCPYAVLDAMAAGVPTLVSDRGGLPELVGEEGTVADDTVEAWATVLGELWADSGLRRERGEAALARARERFTPERYLEGLISIYRATGASVD